jgi:hypothetical protein
MTKWRKASPESTLSQAGPSGVRTDPTRYEPSGWQRSAPSGSALVGWRATQGMCCPVAAENKRPCIDRLEMPDDWLKGVHGGTSKAPGCYW